VRLSTIGAARIFFGDRGDLRNEALRAQVRGVEKSVEHRDEQEDDDAACVMAPQAGADAEQVDERFEGEGQHHGGEQGDEDGGGEVQEREETEDRDDGRTRPDEIQVGPLPPLLLHLRSVGLRGIRRFLRRGIRRFGG